MNKQLADRITEYLAIGGLFNPELANHAAVRDLLIDIRQHLTETNMKYKPEDRVQKIGGSYQAVGTIKAAWLADDGTPRYVFRFDVPNGMLHIFNETQLEPYTETK